MEKNISETTYCYMCDEKATDIEHVPARCFFPPGHRKNLMTVPSCKVHNCDTSKDDEYVRGIIVSSSGNNAVALKHWRGKVRDSFIHIPKLFMRTFEKREANSFLHDRTRIDAVIIKIAYALYYREYGKRWHSVILPFYENMHFDDGKNDIEVRLPNYHTIPAYNVYEGHNPEVFKYYFLDGTVNKQPNCILKMVFYEGFTVVVIPKDPSTVI